MENTESSPATVDAPETYRVLAYRMGDLEKKVARFARKSGKLGLVSPVTVEVIGEEIVPERDPFTGLKTGRVFVYKVVELHGEAPVVAGHTFVARIEHTEAGNVISKAPGVRDVAVPPEMRDGPATCDHCKTSRRRNDTFILRVDETGKLIRVGRNCLADYLRTTDAADALSIWSLLRDLAAFNSEEESFGSPNADFSLEHFVACAFRAVELGGWVSKKEAYYEEKRSTASAAAFACGPRPTMCWEAAEGWDEAQPTAANRTEAKEAVEWAKGLEGTTDYEHNLRVVCSLSYLKAKNEGVAASVVLAFRRYREKEIARALEAKRVSKVSGHFGKVGSRYVRKLTVSRISSWDGTYGLTVLYTMEDEDGNAFKWFSSGGCKHPSEDRSLDVGDSLHFTFAVKAHGEYKGRKETTVARATPSVEAPSHKWMNPATGEVFKSKKAMAATSEVAK